MRKNDLIFLKNFSSWNMAELTKELLEANGIQSLTQRDNRLPVGFGGTGGIDLFVRKKDFRRAKKIIRNLDI